MKNPIPIIYAGYWDFPLSIVVRYGDLQLFLDRDFDEGIDDYERSYAVYLLPDIADSEFCKKETWQQLPEGSTRDLGRIKLDEIEFDPTRREAIDAEAIVRLLERNGIDVKESRDVGKPQTTVRFIYREFSEVPRSLVARYKNLQIYLLCKKDESTGDYESEYNVLLLPDLPTSRIVFGSWLGFEILATHHLSKSLGKINVSEVHFDPTKRKEIDVEPIIPLLEKSGIALD